MRVYDVFGKPVVHCHCSDARLYDIQRFFEIYDRWLNQPEVVSKEQNYGGRGNVLSNVGTMHDQPGTAPELMPLREWMYREVMGIRGVYGLGSTNKMIWKRSWVNRMLNPSRGRIHNHSNPDWGHETNRLVMIFYPKFTAGNGGRLTFVDIPQDCQQDFLDLEDFSDQQKFKVDAGSGDLIIHPLDLWHSVEDYTGEEPRYSLIFEIKLVEDQQRVI